MERTQETRPAAVAGIFYPGTRRELANEVQELLAGTRRPRATARAPKALIVPHAGYIYSGPIAASAYAQLAPWRSSIRRVILLGPVHRVPVRGLALPGVDAFHTPLGSIPVDHEAGLQLSTLTHVTTSRLAHAQEHSLEVQLPFLQETLDHFTLLPLAVGDASAEEVADVLELLWGGPETLIVVSSDLSHYLPYEQARHIDADTCTSIQGLRHDLSHEQACGGTPINGLLLAARRHGLTATLLDYRNSGDTAGDRERVVGYAAFAFSAEN